MLSKVGAPARTLHINDGQAPPPPPAEYPTETCRNKKPRQWLAGLFDLR
ncbi:MAG: hypothetical protein JWP58_2335 [Hymenobacter sp.]|nr:hypothetical protein [Hymenobacter sp.]